METIIHSDILTKQKRQKGYFTFTFKIPWVTKTEFLLTISRQYKADKCWEKLKENINKGIISWFNNKFSTLTSQEVYDRQ